MNDEEACRIIDQVATPFMKAAYQRYNKLIELGFSPERAIQDLRNTAEYKDSQERTAIDGCLYAAWHTVADEISGVQDVWFGAGPAFTTVEGRAQLARDLKREQSLSHRVITGIKERVENYSYARTMSRLDRAIEKDERAAEKAEPLASLSDDERQRRAAARSEEIRLRHVARQQGRDERQERRRDR